ncbi:Rieske 2Fe-2S domain-containing protein [Noviherbaspirillum sedimenti]|nr:Rieske 2Fe-2S domain-containing protein [Noviherbaspirillum sedimenti]
MLSHEDNALMCEVDPGTPMHETMKRYWLPATLSSVLSGPDCDPVKVTLLGEDYVMFRDSNGKVGMLRERCCHRGASLCLGRVEDGGIRCLYHGWKFDVNGRVLEMPNAKGENFLSRYSQPAYPTHEAANVVWVYLGPADKQPAFPRYPIFDLPLDQVVAQEWFVDANYVQLLEGLVDSSHVGVLHQDSIVRRIKAASKEGKLDAVYKQMADDLVPRLEVEETDYGFHYVAIRELNTDDGAVDVARITAFAMPFINFVATNSTMLAAVPVGNGKTLMFEFNWDWKRPFDAERTEQVLAYHGISDTILDNIGLSRKTYGKVERPNSANNYLQDRAAMRRSETFSGLPNFHPEDIAMAISMGPISDRTKENLVPSDQACVRMRRVLIESARRVIDGKDPIGVQSEILPRGTQGSLRKGEAWQSVLAKQENLNRSFGQFAAQLDIKK